MGKLKKIEGIVEKILERREDTRESDDVLYLCVCEYFHRGISSMTVKDFLKARGETSCPSYVSVTRTRRKIFNRRPELKPPKITELREDMIDVYVDYATSC
jgi:hypothetical protein